MLVEMSSSVFKEKGKVRPPIRFKKGLNVVLGKPANKKSSMRDVKIYGYGKTREKYNKKAVRKGRPKGRRSTVIPPRQGQAASPCLRPP